MIVAKVKTALKNLNRQRIVGILAILAMAGIGAHFLVSSHAQSPYASGEAESGSLLGTTLIQTDNNASGSKAVQFGYDFNYGFDFDQNMTLSPTATGSNVQDAVTSALAEMSNFSGSMVDQSIDGFGANDPEPNPVPTSTSLSSSNTELSSIASRINLITAEGGVPVMTLVAAPPWMVGCNNYTSAGLPCPSGADTNSDCVEDSNSNSLTASPPCPAHYQDFAKLCAYIAQQFPQVKYFVVWSELRGFQVVQSGSPTTIDAANYTNMYNDIYTAIKAVRPDAQVGGPYANFAASPCNQPPNFPAACPADTLSGPWGNVNANLLPAIQYWLANKVGADFIAMDGGTEIASKCTDSISVAYSCATGNDVDVDPVTASEKYAAVDTWIKSQTNLPIWWMESHIEPAPDTATSWTDPQAAAARIATLAIMNSSGATVGMQWDPQDQANWADMGLWTETTEPVADGGGQPTLLANELQPILYMMRQRLTLVPDQPTGVLAATGGSKLLVVNTNNAAATASVNGQSINLTPGQVKTESTP